MLCVAFTLTVSAPSAAEDGTTFRRTTPRAPLRVSAEEIVFGIPGGRAWGLESPLIRIGAHAAIALDLGVRDDGLREAFVRIAWYDRDAGRPRQTLIEDAPGIWLYETPAVMGLDKRIHTAVLRADGYWSHLADWWIPAGQRSVRDRIGLRPTP